VLTYPCRADGYGTADNCGYDHGNCRATDGSRRVGASEVADRPGDAPDGTLHVVEPGTGASIASTGPCRCCMDPLRDALQVGDQVRIFGLDGEQGDRLNDKLGRCSGEETADKLWPVLPEDGASDEVVLRRENMVRIESLVPLSERPTMRICELSLEGKVVGHYDRSQVGRDRSPRCRGCKSTTGPFLRCSGCRTERFCGRDCIKSAWKEHKLVCQHWKRWHEVNEPFVGKSLLYMMNHGPAPHCFYARAFLIIRQVVTCSGQPPYTQTINTNYAIRDGCSPAPKPSTLNSNRDTMQERSQPATRALATNALKMLLRILSSPPFFFTFDGMQVDEEILALFFSCLSETGRGHIDLLLQPVAASLSGAAGYSYRELVEDIALPHEWEGCRAPDFQTAAQGGCMACFYKLSVTPGASRLDVSKSSGQTPLIVGCKYSSLRSVAHLLLHGAVEHVNFGDAAGCRPLHFVIHSRHMLRRQMQETKSKMEKEFRKMQLERCEAGASATLVAVLVHHGADMNARDKADETPVMHALAFHNVPALKILLRLNAKIDKDAVDLWQDVVRDSPHGMSPDEFAANREASRLFEEAMGQGKRRYICDRVGCEQRAGKLMCANCARARYCSRACQRAAWKLHKEACRQMVSGLLRVFIIMNYLRAAVCWSRLRGPGKARHLCVERARVGVGVSAPRCVSVPRFTGELVWKGSGLLRMLPP